jgi:pimeloyl-ACP methyl ester carboxylesterase
MSTDTTQELTIDAEGPIPVTFNDIGSGHPFLLIHGGAGPQSVTAFANLLATTRVGRVITPTHPGFGGTPRPERIDSINALARLYGALLDQLQLENVTVIGNSIGGWIAAEMALLDSPRIGGLVLVDAAGIEVEGHRAVDFFSLSLDEVAQLSYHDPVRFRIDPSTMPEAQRNAFAGNRASLAIYAGQSMADPKLRGRLAAVTVPTLVLWGDSDRMFDAEYGRAYAASIPGATFKLLIDTGHVPQIETPEQLLDPIWDFATAQSSARAAN